MKMEEKEFFGRTLSAAEQGFLHSSEGRMIRILYEMNAPKAMFREHSVENTIVFFGSARTPSLDVAQNNLRELEEEKKSADSTDLQQKIRRAQNELKMSRYYEAAADLAEKLTLWSLDIVQQEKHFYICSGGGPGIMEAANRGADRAGGHSIGFNINLPFEQDPNTYQTDQVSFEFHYFFVRKFWFAYLAKALVVFPGGFGTLDELFEMLTLMQTGKMVKPMPVVLFGKEFWDEILNFDALVKWGLVSEKDLKLFRIYDDVDEAFDYIKTSIINNFL